MNRRGVRRHGPLRVIFVVPDLRVGGAERHVATLLPALDRDRVSPSVVCLGEEGALYGTLVAAGVPATSFGLGKKQAIRAVARLVVELRRTSPDIVVTRGYSAEAIGRIAAKIAGVAHTVVWVHNCGDVEPRGRVRRWVDRLLDPVTTSYFGVAHGQVPYLTDDLGYPVEKIRVIHNGVDLDQYSSDRRDDLVPDLGLEPDDLVVAVVAVMRPEKDHATVLRAMPEILARVPRARLLLVGDGPLRPALQRLTQELDIADRVAFVGARSDVPAVLRQVDVLTLTSYTVECFPMAVLEAMAMGVPAVCTAVGGVPELIDDGTTGFLVPPRDTKQLAERLIDVLKDNVGRSAMGKAARARIEEMFTLQRSTEDAMSALEATAGLIGRADVRRRPVRLTVVLDLVDVGGAEILLLNLFRQFNPTVVVPRLVCLREDGPLAAEFRAAGFVVDVLERSGRYDLRTLPRLVALLRREATDVVLVNHHHRAALTMGRLAARVARVRANIVAAHDMDLTAVGLRCLPRHDVETLFLSDALVLLAPSQGRYLREQEGVRRFPWRTVDEVVIPNGIDVPELPTEVTREAARGALGLEAGDIAVGIIARLSSQKAHEVLIAAVAKLAPDHPELRLLIIGGGHREEELRALVMQLGLSGRVRFLGVRRDVAALLPGLDISCLSSAHEGAPMSVIESMAAALPIVTTDCGALRDMITDGAEGYLVPVGDVDALADRIAALAADPQLRHQLGAAGRRRAERNHRIEFTARRYEQLLVSVSS